MGPRPIQGVDTDAETVTNAQCEYYSFKTSNIFGYIFPHATRENCSPFLFQILETEDINFVNDQKQ